MTVTNASFRADFPEFASTTTFPDSVVNFWVNLAPNLLNACRFTASIVDFAIELLVAHGVTIQAKNIAAGAKGMPGQASGPLASKSVGGVSASYDTGAGTVADAGWMNLTSYGVQLMGLIQIAGMGGVQLGASPSDNYAVGAGIFFG